MCCNASRCPSHAGSQTDSDRDVSQHLDAIRDISKLDPTTTDFVNERLRVARSTIATVEGSLFMIRSIERNEQLFILRELQNIAYDNVDSGGVQDIAQWCMRQWLQMLHSNRNDIDALTGKKSRVSSDMS